MLSLITLLAHDTDLPAPVRAALRHAQDAPSALARAQATHQAAVGLTGVYGLTADDISALLAYDDAPARQAA